MQKGELQKAALADAIGDDLALLARLFPVLRELTTAEAMESLPAEVNRERAFAVVKRLIERVTAHRPIVLLLDDLHWADEDSLALLAHLMRGPATPGLFVMATAWPPGESDGEALDRFLRKMRRPGGDEVLTQLWLGPLGSEDGARVVESALRQSAEFAPGAIEQICKEAAGNPVPAGRAGAPAHRASRAGHPDGVGGRAPPPVDPQRRRDGARRAGGDHARPRRRRAVARGAARRLARAVARRRRAAPPVRPQDPARVGRAAPR